MISVLFRRFRQIAPVLFIALLVFALFGETLLPPEGKIIFGGDLLSQFYFWKKYLVESIKSGFIPFWNPYNFSGTPFLAHPSTTFLYPATLIFIFFPLNIAFSFNYFLHFLIGGLGMYYLGKRYTNMLGGLSASLVFILSGFYSSRIYAGHVEILATASWIPFVLLASVNFFESATLKNWIFLIVVFSLEILSGYQTVVLFTLEFLLFYALYKLFTKKKGMAMFILFSLGIVMSIGLTAISWLPTNQFISLSTRSKDLPYEFASWGAISPSSLKLMFFDPFNKEELGKLAYGFTEGPLPNFFDYYLGIIPLLLFIFTIFIKILIPKKVLLFIFTKDIFADFWFIVIAAFFFLVISFANSISPNFHFLLYQLIPYYRFFRIPAQHLIMVVFALSLLTGIIIGNLKFKAVGLIIIILLTIQLFSYSKRYFILTDLPQNSFDHSLITQFKEDESLFRLLPDFRIGAPMRKAFDFNASSMYQIYSASGYDPLILFSYYHFINLLNKDKNSTSLIPLYHVEIPPPNPNSSLIDFLNIKYIILGPAWETIFPKSNKLEKLLVNDLYSLYQNKKVLPRFYFVSDAKVYSSESEIEKALINNQIDLSRSVALTKKEFDSQEFIKLKECLDININKNTIKILSYQPNKISLIVNLSCDGILSSSEVYYPGWKAKLDNRQTKILPSNIAFRAIYLPQGKHLVEFYYSPLIYYQGALITLVTFSVLLFIFISPHFINSNLKKIYR